MFSTPQNLFRLFGLGFALIGCGLLVGALLSYRSTAAFLSTAMPATGEVIGYDRRADSEGAITYYPVITFAPAGDDEIEFTASTGSSNRPYAIGASVPLRYDPKLPFNAAIDTPADIWLVTGVLGGLGVVFVLVGGGLFWLLGLGGAGRQPAFRVTSAP